MFKSLLLSILSSHFLGPIFAWSPLPKGVSIEDFHLPAQILREELIVPKSKSDGFTGGIFYIDKNHPNGYRRIYVEDRNNVKKIIIKGKDDCGKNSLIFKAKSVSQKSVSKESDESESEDCSNIPEFEVIGDLTDTDFKPLHKTNKGVKEEMLSGASQDSTGHISKKMSYLGNWLARGANILFDFSTKKKGAPKDLKARLLIGGSGNEDLLFLADNNRWIRDKQGLVLPSESGSNTNLGNDEL